MGGLWTNESEFLKMHTYTDMKGFLLRSRHLHVLANSAKDKDKNKNDKGKKDKDKKGRIRRKTRSRVEQLLVDTGCFHLCPQDKSRPCARVRVHVITKILFVLVNVPKESLQKTKAPKVASLTALANATLHANVITFFELGGFGENLPSWLRQFRLRLESQGL
ncbi:hypothetical protein YC2023_014737 [Brassica napus]